MRDFTTPGVIDGGCVSWRPVRHDPGAQSDGLSLRNHTLSRWGRCVPRVADRSFEAVTVRAGDPRPRTRTWPESRRIG